MGVVNTKELKAHRRKLRNNLTPAEAALWLQLKANKIDGTHWRRQFSVGKYILDFYCPSHKLCVELDGNIHFNIQSDVIDMERTEYLNSKGIKVIRFENKEVWENIDRVLSVIKSNFVSSIENID